MRGSWGFWHHEYWLPPGAIWEDLKESADIHYLQPQHLLLFVSGAMLLIFVQCIFERTLALPLGMALEVSNKQRPKVQTNAMLEGFYILLGRTQRKSIHAFQQINIPPSLVCEMTECSLDLLFQIINEDIKWDWPQN